MYVDGTRSFSPRWVQGCKCAISTCGVSYIIRHRTTGTSTSCSSRGVRLPILQQFLQQTCCVRSSNRSQMEEKSGLLDSPSVSQDASESPSTPRSSKGRGSPIVRRDSSYQHVASRQSLGHKDSPGPALPVDESTADENRFQLGWERAASTYFEDNALEQKMWIQCTLDGAKKRGDDWIESVFTDDVVSGCSACLPDIVVVNDTSITKNTEAFKAKASAAQLWQRVRPSPFCIFCSRLFSSCIETV